MKWKEFVIGFLFVIVIHGIGGCETIHEMTKPVDKTIIIANEDKTIVFARRLPSENEQQYRAVFDGTFCQATLTQEGQHIVIVCNEEPPVVPEAPVVEEEETE